jgi:hypothetical protein
MPATRAAEAVRPAQAKKIIPAGLVGSETSLKLPEIARIILHRPKYYMLGLPESTGYPTKVNTHRTQVAREVA